jgi:hypothetical protein
MKHFFTCNLVAVLFSLVSFTTAVGQACVIDTNSYELFAPASDDLPCAVRGTPYDITLQIFCPPTLGGVNIDSIKVTSFPGLPVGLVKSVYPANGIVYPLGRMCINIAGTTSDTVGFYEILYNGTAFTQAGNAPFSYLRDNIPGALPVYALRVINTGDACPQTDTVATGINRISNRGIAFSVNPNPTTGVFTFALNAEQKLNGEVNVVDVTGKTIYTQLTQAASVYQTTIDLSRFAKGIYFVQYRSTEGMVSKKIVKE